MDRSEVDRTFIRGTGNGGQAINKTSSCVQLVHRRIGIVIKCQESRDRNKNEEIAWERMEDRIREMEKQKYDSLVYSNRFDQIGDSDRSTKKRSYRVKEDLVIDHETGKRCSFKDFSRGRIELLC